MSEPSGGNPPKGAERLEIEKIRQRYGLYKVIAGSLMVAVVSAALPFIIERSKVALEAEQSSRDFVTQYTNLLEREPAAQIALAEYFAHVLPDTEQRKLWVAYRDRLTGLQAEQAEAEQRLAAAENEAEAQSIRREIDILNRRLAPIVPQEISLSDPQLIARTLWGEAHGGSREERVAIASVILNRVRSSRFPDTVSGVVLQPMQFSMWNPNGPSRRAALALAPDDPALAEPLTIANEALSGDLKDPTGGATTYHLAAIRPLWAKGRTPTAIIGKLIFYRLD